MRRWKKKRKNKKKKKMMNKDLDGLKRNFLIKT